MPPAPDSTRPERSSPGSGPPSRPDVDWFRQTIRRFLVTFQGRDPDRAADRDVYMALAYALREILAEKWIETQQTFYREHRKRVYYLSMEFLVGRSLCNTLLCLDLFEEAAGGLALLGHDLDTAIEMEEDAGLGNGGLGRLAACFLDSIATMRLPAYGYGIRYEYGLFYQKIIGGEQVEQPDSWMRYGNPWEFDRTSFVNPVRFGGRVRTYVDERGHLRSQWVDTEDVMAMACDVLVPGFRNGHVINMRLWTAKGSRELDLNNFNAGDYIGAVRSKVQSETISKVLYPSDHVHAGRELRLKQQYFFVAATFHDIMRRFRKTSGDFREFPELVTVQLNDTHPAIAVPELMRLLLDEHGLGWEESWDICVKTFAFTNHTLMPEALETWPVELMERVLPRHMEIIYEINRRFLDEVALRWPGDTRRLRDMSLIAEDGVRRVRMAHLAIVGSHSVNGVARLHSELLKTHMFRDFHEMFPERFNNKTNGITPRRWLLKCNPELADLISIHIGTAWITRLDELRRLEPLADDAAFCRHWRGIKRRNKERLAEIILERCGVEVDPEALFDVQVKRIHEYKRQLLFVLALIAHYQRIVAGEAPEGPPLVAVFAGKAAPSYTRAKLIIRLINAVAETVNQDPRVGGRLKVVFIPNYNVTLAEVIIPAADLSEQISTAGTEASGTGNMKLALNGALTIGTLDGANIEIREEVGPDNMFIFGLGAREAEFERRNAARPPVRIREENPVIDRVVRALAQGAFSPREPGLFQPLVESLMDERDPYLVLRDLEAYLDCREKALALYQDREEWTRRSILNVAGMGRFSSDRVVREYAREIWGIEVE